jgi:excisionase family DNA binding protein
MNDRPTDRPRRWHTIPTVAEELGLSTKTIRRWIDGRRLVAHKLGRQWRIAEEDLRAFLVQRRQG